MTDPTTTPPAERGALPAAVRTLLRLTPDIRVMIVIGYFGLALRLLYMIEGKVQLLDSAPFMTIATLIVGTGGLGAISTWYFGGTRTGSEVMKAQNEALTAAPAPGTTTTTTTPSPQDPAQ